MFQLPIQAAPAPPSTPAASLEPRAAGPSPSPCGWVTVDSADRCPAPQQPPMAYSPRALLRAAGRGSCTECWWWFLGSSSSRFPTIAHDIESDVGPGQGAHTRWAATCKLAHRVPAGGASPAGARCLWEPATEIGTGRAARGNTPTLLPWCPPCRLRSGASCRCLRLFCCLCTPGLPCSSATPLWWPMPPCPTARWCAAAHGVR